jgi:hypothetical protein
MFCVTSLHMNTPHLFLQHIPPTRLYDGKMVSGQVELNYAHRLLLHTRVTGKPRICKLQRYNSLLHIILSVQQILCSVLSCILIKNEIRNCSALWVVESFTHYLEITIKTLLICQIKHGKTA